MNWRALFAVALSVGLALGFAPAFSQAAPGSSSGVASVSLNHYYSITTNGFGVLNDSFTFKNDGTSGMQIPTLQVGLPGSIGSRAIDFVLSPSTDFTLSRQSTSNGTTIASISPNQPTLNAGASSTVALKAFLIDIFNYTSAGFVSPAPSLVLLSPSLNLNVTRFNSTLILPTGGTFAPTPTGFTAPAPGAIAYTMSKTAIRPQASARYLNFTEPNQSAFTPLSVNSLVRTIVPAANGSPMVEDKFSIHNLASYNMGQIRLHLLYSSLSSVTLIPNTEPPLIDPQQVSVHAGVLTFATTSIAAPLLPKSNITLTVLYPIPPSAMTISGNSVTVTVPTSPFIAAPVASYIIQLAPAKGTAPSGQTALYNKTVDPLTTGSVALSYSVSVGWAADQAVPAAALIFAVAFAMFAVQRPAAKEKGEEEEKESLEISDVVKAFEDKTGLETQYMEKLSSATKGSIGRTDFDRMRNEVSDLRGRALQRFNELRRDLGSGRQFDLLTRVGEAEKEEDRAFRDLLNLYLQYHGARMNDETFKRLQPNYRKRVESAVNHLSDLLDEVRTEEK